MTASVALLIIIGSCMFFAQESNAAKYFFNCVACALYWLIAALDLIAFRYILSKSERPLEKLGV